MKVKARETNLYFYSPANLSEEWAGGTVEDKVTCKKAKATSQLTGANTLEIVIQWQSCLERGKEACSSPGAGGGSINSMPLVGTLGYLGSSMPPFGVVLEPKSGTVVTEFKCFFAGGGVAEFKVTGAVIGQIEGITNSASKKYTLALRASSATGAQQWTGFNGVAGSSYLKDEVTSPVCMPCKSPAGLSMTDGMKGPNLLVEG